MKLKRLATCALALLFGPTACDSQVGEDYTGEVMFQLKGSVQADDTATHDQVPSLVFGNSEDGIYYDYVVRGDVKGVPLTSASFFVMQAQALGTVMRFQKNALAPTSLRYSSALTGALGVGVRF